MHHGEHEPPELVELERLISAFGDSMELQVLCEVSAGARSFPVYAIALGNPAPSVPAVGYFGGVHGVERIGSAVVLAFLRSVIMRLRWDATLRHQLEHLRMVFMPVVNPGGLARGTRANPVGVDLMRNAPLDARDPVPFLLGALLQGADSAGSPAASAPSEARVSGRHDEPVGFLLAIMNDDAIETRLRIEAAKALLPYFRKPAA